jgi:hypothetical protein
MSSATKATNTTTTTTTKALGRIAVIGVLVAAAGTSSCGGVTDARAAARDKATKAACDSYQRCMLIGPNADDTYATYDSCETVWKANWEQAWPAATCNTINQVNLNVCLSAIAATDCMSFVDFLATLGKCQAQDICVGLADAGSGS